MQAFYSDSVDTLQKWPQGKWAIDTELPLVPQTDLGSSVVFYLSFKQCLIFKTPTPMIKSKSAFWCLLLWWIWTPIMPERLCVQSSDVQSVLINVVGNTWNLSSLIECMHWNIHSHWCHCPPQRKEQAPGCPQLRIKRNSAAFNV